MEIQLSILFILCLAAPQYIGMHGMYKYKPLNLHKGPRERIKLQSLLLFYNTLHNNTRVCILGVTLYDDIS